MGRAKLRMEPIQSEKLRNRMYQKRKPGIINKARELRTLCDLDLMAMIIYPPDSNEPEIWPDQDIKKTIASYKSKKGTTAIKSYDLVDILQDRLKKAEDELFNTRKKNLEAKYPTWFEELNCFNEFQLTQFAMALEQKESSVRSLLEFKKRNINDDQLPPILDNNSLMSGYEYKHPGMMHYPGMGMGMGLDLFNNEAFEQPMGPALFDQWAFQQQAVQGGGFVDNFVMQELEGHVNNGEVVNSDHQESSISGAGNRFSGAGRMDFNPPAAGGFGVVSTAKISVNGTLVEPIIGKNGVNFNQIYRLTGVKLSISDHESNPNLKDIELEGTFEQIKQASQMVQELIVNISNAGWYVNNGENVKSDDQERFD